MAHRSSLIAPALYLVTSVLTIATDRVPFSSDQAVATLMALDIRDRGEHPAFYYGAEYGGSLEPHLLSFVFRVLPATAVTYRGFLVGLGFLTVLAFQAFAQRALGKARGAFAAALLSAAPSFFYFKILTSDGAYASFLLLATFAMLLLLRADEQVSSGRSAARTLGLLGFVLGLGWWVHVIFVFVAVAVLAGGIAAGDRRWLRIPHLLAFSSGTVLGSAPWLARNLTTGWLSLRISELNVATAPLVDRLSDLVALSIPMLFGPDARGTVSPPGGVLLLAAICSALLAGACWVLSAGDSLRVRPARVALVMAGTLVVVSVAAVLRTARTDYREPRYLLAVFLVPPLAIAAALGPDRVRKSRLVAGAAAVLWVGLSAVSHARSPAQAGTQRGTPAKPGVGGPLLSAPSGMLLAALDREGLTRVYCGYWCAYRLTFESGRRVVATPFGIRSLTRLPRDREDVDQSPRPAFLLEGPDRKSLERWLDSHGAEHRARRVGAFTLFWDLPADRVDQLRSCVCVPSPEETPASSRLRTIGAMMPTKRWVPSGPK